MNFKKLIMKTYFLNIDNNEILIGILPQELKFSYFNSIKYDDTNKSIILNYKNKEYVIKLSEKDKKINYPNIALGVENNEEDYYFLKQNNEIIEIEEEKFFRQNI